MTSRFFADRPLVLGHRGSPRLFPENSLRSFDAAIAAGADGIELDVRCSADGVLIVRHNATVPTGYGLRRTWVHTLPFAELRAAAKAEAPTLHHRRIPSGAPARFAAAVKHLAGRTRLNVEVKTPGYEEEVLDVLRRHVHPDDFVITSFNEDVVAACRARARSAQVGLLLGSRGHSKTLGFFPIRRAQATGADFLVVHNLLADRSLLNRAQKFGLPVMVYTVNRERRLETLLNDVRVAGVITDVPERAVAIREVVGAG